jgi:hypothetical protein
MVVPFSVAVVVVLLSAVVVLVSIVTIGAVVVSDARLAEAVPVEEVFGLHGPASTTTNEARVAKADTSNLLETTVNKTSVWR